MAVQLIDTKDLTGKKVWIEKPRKKDPDATKKMGKIRAFVFHPKEKRCVGFIVKRPDVAWMFHRKDLFVAYNGYDLVDGDIVVRDEPAATDKGACNALGVNWDECVLWVGLPVMCQDGTEFGLVGSVSYDAATGAIDHLDVTQGATANALLGQRHVPAGMIKGFRYGMGAELVISDDEEGGVRGAILVDNAVKDLVTEGGVAEKAGEATAVVVDKAHHVADAVKPKMSEAAAVAGEAVNKGAYATGRQLKRASGMFSEFKEEYDKARGLKEPTAASRASRIEEGESVEVIEVIEEVEVAEAVKPRAAEGLTAGQPESCEASDGPKAELATDGVAESAQSAKAAHDIPKTEEAEEVEYSFVDEDGNEIVFVDEDGNVITDPDLIDAEFGETIVDEVAAKSATSAEGKKPTVGEAVGAHLKKAGGMFSAFKEEYDKARHE